ncbi:NAD-dependent epimerase/dehydratase family protein [Streptomyces sp. NBC_00212]|uniref:NAD-dependent epimerase/dehydratase family protein n=1 Tax=Streptomyces sp. NBC_00212 TaxID=2975684 RepID=UPI00324AE2E9
MHHDDLLHSPAGSTVLVTGCAGLIGSRITLRLRQLGGTPIALCTLDAYPPHIYRDLFDVDATDPDVIPGDIKDTALVNWIMPRCDYVIHAAALADVAACTRRPRSTP